MNRSQCGKEHPTRLFHFSLPTLGRWPMHCRPARLVQGLSHPCGLLRSEFRNNVAGPMFRPNSRIACGCFLISAVVESADTRFGNFRGTNPSHSDTVLRAILRKLCSILGPHCAPKLKESED